MVENYANFMWRERSNSCSVGGGDGGFGAVLLSKRTRRKWELTEKFHGPPRRGVSEMIVIHDLVSMRRLLGGVWLAGRRRKAVVVRVR